MKWTIPILVVLGWAGLVAVSGATTRSDVPSRARVHATEARDAEDTSAHRPPLIVIRGLGHVPPRTLRSACRYLLAGYPVRCEVRPAHAAEHAISAFVLERGQLDARIALELMFETRSDDAAVEIQLTDLDIFEAGKPYVFGLASLTDRLAVVSLARIADDPRASKRLQKLLLHEAGHALGLHHHDDPGCVMRQDPTVAALDTAPTDLCEACHARLAANAERLSQPGRIALGRARGQLARDHVEAAREELARILFRQEWDAGVLNEFGQAFFEVGRYNEAISVLRFLIKQAPEFAPAHVNLGLSYQMRDQAGDRSHAIEHLERALELRPHWELVASHLSGLQREAPTAQGPR